MWDARRAISPVHSACCATTQRGHGKTEAPAGRYSFDTLIADALALMDALEGRAGEFLRPVRWAARPRSGLAQRHPDRIARAIVCDSGLRLDAAVGAAMGGADRGGAAGGMEPLVPEPDGRALGFHPTSWRRTRPISTRCAR
jgi:3-oxoadipate enol-lactonase